jgi:putative PIN family toxin of toxin-antitoxin system
VLVVLDSNILLSALISPHGVPGRIYEAWQDGRFILVTCAEQLDEIRVASRYPKLRAILKPHLVGRMIHSMQRAHILTQVPRKHQASDPSDAFLLDLAELARADYVVTGDRRSGLLDIGRVAGAKIVTPTFFPQSALNARDAQ